VEAEALLLLVLTEHLLLAAMVVLVLHPQYLVLL
jgi:hypothetical protein